MPDEGYTRAIELLHASVSPQGFRAAVDGGTNYDRVWARDGVVCGLAATLADDDGLVDAFERTLTTLREHRGPSGEIPSNVGADGSVSYGTVVGRVDSPLWYAIGVAALASARPAAAEEHREAVAGALHLAAAWELNAGGLVHVPPGGSWLDEVPLHGYLLNVQLLRLWAVRVWDSADAERVSEALQAALLGSAGWAACAGPTGRSDRFEGLGVALALLLDVGAEHAAAQLAAVAAATGSALVPALWPPIEPTDPLWPELRSYHLYEFRNEPGRFHNGGLWPMVTGFAAAAAARAGDHAGALALADAIDAANAAEDWSFAEFHDPLTGSPGGVRQQAWSAAAAVIARQTAEGATLV